jgi:2-oxoglutarate/2-oxoacid ferredoxin oxidoreductase subunit beta
MATVKDFSNEIRPTWCPGCGDFGIWNALKRALVEAGLEAEKIMLVTGIGCGSKMPDYMHVPGLNTLHGRTLAVATGYKLANHAKKVICVHGDGDGYSMGANHLIQAIRRNIGLLDIIEDNHVYGLTKGQYSPTSRSGWITRTSPDGAIERPLNPLALAISQGATFVARGFALDIVQLSRLIVTGLSHRGFGLIDVMQPCVSFNRPMSYAWYRERVYQVADTGHDVTNRDAALAISFQYPGDGDRIPLGIIYQDESVPAYEDQVPTLAFGPLATQPFYTRPAGDYQRLIEELL